MSPTPIASHRGGAILWPENSLLAFRNSLALGVEQIELDVHPSADGQPVVIHDPTLERTTDGQGPIVAQSLAGIRRLRVKGSGGEPIPSLEDVLALAIPTGCLLRLELKSDRDGRPYPHLLDRCLELLDATGLRPRTILLSFEPLSIAEAAAAGGFAGLAWLVDSKPWRGMGELGASAICRACGATELGLPLAEIPPGLPERLRGAGLGVGGWGANDAATIRRGLDLGLTALTTDDPVLALRIRNGADIAAWP